MSNLLLRRIIFTAHIIFFQFFFFAPDAYSLATKNIFPSWFLPKQKAWAAAVHWAWAGLGRKTLQLRRKMMEWLRFLFSDGWVVASRSSGTIMKYSNMYCMY